MHKSSKILLGVMIWVWVSVTFFPGSQPQASQINSGWVSGSGNLDTAGYIPFVLTPGILTISKAAGQQLFWDNTNHRMGVGRNDPGAEFEVGGASSSTIRVRNSTSTGYVDMATGNASLTGYFAWFRANNTRNGFMGNDNGAGITLNLENSSNFNIVGGSILWPTAGTSTNCSSAASPAVCAASAAGSVVIATGATTVVVNTTAVTANSQILVIPDNSLGTKLSVTCNAMATIANFLPTVTARTAATSFTITITGPVAVNPACYSYTILN